MTGDFYRFGPHLALLIYVGICLDTQHEQPFIDVSRFHMLQVNIWCPDMMQYLGIYALYKQIFLRNYCQALFQPQHS